MELLKKKKENNGVAADVDNCKHKSCRNDPCGENGLYEQRKRIETDAYLYSSNLTKDVFFNQIQETE